MELRLANDEGTKPVRTGMNLSNEDNLENPLTGRPPRTYEEEKNPWDFDMEEEPYVVSSVNTTTSSDFVNTDYGNNEHVALKISRYLVYLFFALQVLALLWACSQGPVNVMVNMYKLSPLFTVSVILCCVDAILINIYGEKNTSLAVFALMLDSFYPLVRNKHTDGHAGVGAVCTVAYIVAAVIMVTQLWSGLTKYGEVLKLEDSTAREEIAVLMDQTLTNGQRLGDKIDICMHTENYKYIVEDGVTYVAFVGNGKYNLEAGNFVDLRSAIIDTQLVFYKEDGKPYQLGAVVFNEQITTDEQTAFYWENVILK